MRKLTSEEGLEAVVGARRQAMLMKSIDTIDDGCRSVLANAPIALFGFRDWEGTPRTTLVGGVAGFARADSPKRISLEVPADRPSPVVGVGVSMVFLMPGIGETLRLNGVVSESVDTRIGIDLEEAFVHCAKCILRSELWSEVRADPVATRVAVPADPDGDTSGPLADGAVAEFITSSPFVAVSSWDGDGSSDTSPKGDHPGFIQIVDSRTLAVPDRKGNQRTDTFHNLLTCDQVSLAAVVPGRDDVLHLGGTAFVTDDPSLVSTMALGEKPPKAALIVHVDYANLASNEAVRRSRLWDQSAHVDTSGVPDLMHLSAQHLANSKSRGAKASMTRAVTKALAASPSVLRRGVNHGYRKELEDEGYRPTR
jgi:predicted pyridoxine 5'-phosphate oxidase superfamily flavin-nucleotide-binding protein